jgi:hypothetical protein
MEMDQTQAEATGEAAKKKKKRRKNKKKKKKAEDGTDMATNPESKLSTEEGPVNGEDSDIKEGESDLDFEEDLK